MLDLVFDVGLVPDMATSVFEEIPTDRDHFVFFKEGIECLFGFALVAYAVLVVLAAPCDVIRAPVNGRFGFLSHESIIPHPTLNARPVCVYYDFFFFYFLFFSLDT